MADKYKVVVIGAGPGGYVAAIRAAQLGMKTAIIEKEYVGGVCLNWGCIPSKALLYVSELKRTVVEAEKIGLISKDVGIDLDKLRRHKEDTVKRLTGGVKILLDKAGVKTYMGQASFQTATRLEIISGVHKTIIDAEYVIIATGSTTADLPILRVDGKSVVGAREMIDLPRIPATLGVIGAGPIGVEMATVYNTLGSKVTIIELLDAVLPMLDKDISSAAERALKKQGMEIYTSSQVTAASKKGDKVELTFKTPQGEQKITFDMVLLSVGMKPNSKDLNLEKIGVKIDSSGFITVDEHMRTNVSNIYAIGDVAGGLLLAHKASHEGAAAVESIAGSGTGADWKAVPYAVFTDPEIAGVGMTEQEAAKNGRKIKIGRFPYRAVGKGIATLALDGFSKVISDAETDEILGIHIFGPHSGDIIYAGTALIEFDGTSDDLGHLMAIHPTLSEALMEAGLNVHKRAIHIVNM
ncbi:MAG: dihydrolipoyl dehydrogenase [candidate division Zixibacteria bacterium RBG_16_53_22]|nr:MAG: dihydrolipoyl dehydrogenase [candidate division Zixibacteria bacterium RBG_16_53_22]